MIVEPVELAGRHVRLVPLSVSHAEGLLAVAERDLLRFVVFDPPSWDAAGFTEYVRAAIEIPERFPFAVLLTGTSQVVGTTSFLDVRPAHRGLEIGYTWIGRAWQGTRINPEMKYLMLRHAFESLGAIRVQLKTDARNLQSQAALAKLGARREGVLRKHMVLPDGHVRDSVMFSITDDEWPAVKVRLERRLDYFEHQRGISRGPLQDR